MLKQKVLLLLPESENKLLMWWQAPFSVARRVGPVNYEVWLANSVFHVNLLKASESKEKTAV